MKAFQACSKRVKGLVRMRYVTYYLPFSEKVRLFNGTDRCNGRLEVERDHQWVKICKNHWTNKEEALVCRELECGTPDKKAVRIAASSNLGSFTASCVGAETSIATCPLQSNPSACEAVVVYCTGKR